MSDNISLIETIVNNDIVGFTQIYLTKIDESNLFEVLYVLFSKFKFDMLSLIFSHDAFLEKITPEYVWSLVCISVTDLGDSMLMINYLVGKFPDILGIPELLNPNKTIVDIVKILLSSPIKDDFNNSTINRFFHKCLSDYDFCMELLHHPSFRNLTQQTINNSFDDVIFQDYNEEMANFLYYRLSSDFNFENMWNNIVELTGDTIPVHLNYVLNLPDITHEIITNSIGVGYPGWKPEIIEQFLQLLYDSGKYP